MGEGRMLIELVTVMAATGVMFLVVMPFFLAVRRVVGEVVNGAKVLFEAREALHWLGRDVMGARSLLASGGRVKVSTLAEGGRSVEYRFVKGKGLIRRVEGKGSMLLAPHALRVEFRRRGRTLKVRLLLPAGGGRLDIWTEFLARNLGGGEWR